MLAPWIISHFPNHRIYVEPFGGGASVLLRKPKSYAEVYNDLDEEVVNLFRVVRGQGKKLQQILRNTPYSRDEYQESFEVSEDPLEQARRTVIRSFMGFGSNALNRSVRSGFRSNSNRSGTPPARDWANYAELLSQLIERLRGVVIENRDALEVIAAQDSYQTLHYCDPPYPKSTRSTLMQGHPGYNHEMTDDDHRQLAKVLRDVFGMVVISGYACDLYDQDLYPDWKRVESAALKDGARPAIEVLWMNKSASNALGGTLF